LEEDGGKYTKLDSRNPAWKDSEFDSDDDNTDAIWPLVNLTSSFTFVKKLDKEVIRDVRTKKSELAKQMIGITFRT
jgi:hypothetical protein